MKRNKFYVAHPKIWGTNDHWSKPTMKAAIEHAEEILNSNQYQEYALIVQVVRVVRRQKMPLVVEKV